MVTINKAKTQNVLIGWITCTLGCLTIFYFVRISRTLVIASKLWFTASAGPDSRPLVARGRALGPVAPVLPFGRDGCNIIISQINTSVWDLSFYDFPNLNCHVPFNAFLDRVHFNIFQSVPTENS